MGIDSIYDRALLLCLDYGSVIGNIWIYEKGGITFDLGTYMEEHKEETYIEIPEGIFGVYLGSFNNHTLDEDRSYTFVFPKSCKYVSDTLYTNNDALFGTINITSHSLICAYTIFKNCSFDFRKCEHITELLRHSFNKVKVDTLLFGKLSLIHPCSFCNVEANRIEIEEANNIAQYAFNVVMAKFLAIYGNSLSIDTYGINVSCDKVVLGHIVHCQHCMINKVNDLYIGYNFDYLWSASEDIISSTLKELQSLSDKEDYVRYIEVHNIINRLSGIQSAGSIGEVNNFMSDVLQDLAIYKRKEARGDHAPTYTLQDSIESLFVDAALCNNIHLYKSDVKEPWNLKYTLLDSDFEIYIEDV